MNSVKETLDKVSRLQALLCPNRKGQLCIPLKKKNKNKKKLDYQHKVALWTSLFGVFVFKYFSLLPLQD